MNTTRVAIVSAANSRYMSLLRGLVRSVLDVIPASDEEVATTFPYMRRAKNKAHEFSFSVLDCGLLPHDIEWLTVRGVSVVSINQPTLEHSRTFEPGNIGFTERHALPTHVPGFDIYMWIDADAWVQSFSKGIWPYLTYAETHDVAIVPEIDRQIVYNPHLRTITKGWALGNYSKYFSAEAAKTLAEFPMLNNGVFAARGDSPVWQLYASAMQFALDTNNGKPEFGIDQVSLAYAIYCGGVKFYPLPLGCNWMVTHATPVLFDKTDTLLEPMWPFNQIGIVHLLDHTKWQRVGIQRVDENGNSISGDALILDYFNIKKVRDQ